MGVILGTLGRGAPPVRRHRFPYLPKKVNKVKKVETERDDEVRGWRLELVVEVRRRWDKQVEGARMRRSTRCEDVSYPLGWRNRHTEVGHRII